MHKLKTALIQFNRTVLPLNIVVNLLLLWKLMQYPPYALAIFITVLTKGAVYLFVFWYQYYMQNRTWYYYRNAGFSMKWLFIYSCLIDILLFFAAYSLLYFVHKA